MVKPLHEILSYKNPWVIKRFKKSCQWFRGDAEDVQLIFEDLKRFLWLYGTMEQERKKHPNEDFPDISISISMIVIDEMWHAFILNTQFYTDFCNDYIGGYLHHPVPVEKHISNAKSLGEERANEIFVTEMVGLVVDQFGEEVANRWFDEYFRFARPEV